MIRTLGGIVAGVAAAITIIMVTELVGNQIAPAPERLEFQEIGESPPLPILTLLFPALGWFLGALIGGFLSIRISDRSWTAWVVAGAVLAAAIFNFLLMPTPTWLIIVGLIVPVLGGWLAQRVCAMASSRRSSS